MRNLAYLYQATQSQAMLDYINKNAQSIWNNDRLLTLFHPSLLLPSSLSLVFSIQTKQEAEELTSKYIDRAPLWDYIGEDPLTQPMQQDRVLPLML